MRGGGWVVAMGALALSGCASTSPRSGWSRAPDLAVYAAMDTAGDIAREQEVLCLGRDPGGVNARWQRDFGARRDWIAAALAQRYGADAVRRAESGKTGRPRCETLAIDQPWRRSYERLLKQLELRLYPKDHWRG